jgi:hypothetical protein
LIFIKSSFFGFGVGVGKSDSSLREALGRPPCRRTQARIVDGRLRKRHVISITPPSRLQAQLFVRRCVPQPLVVSSEHSEMTKTKELIGEGFIVALRTLHSAADAFPPLKSAAGALAIIDLIKVRCVIKYNSGTLTYLLDFPAIQD